MASHLHAELTRSRSEKITVDLSIIIVNWNSKEYLQKCLDSILSSTNGMECEILVIDSGSFDGCEEMLRQHYPQVFFIQSEENLGFAKSNNMAFKSSRGQYLLFLNPDTEVESNAIEILYSHLISLPEAGIVGARLLNSDRTIQTSCIQAFPNIINQLLDFNVLREYFPRAKLWGMRPLFNEGNAPTAVDAVSGACLMIKGSIFEEIGMFSSDYFMYSEDIDLCFQARKAGWMSFYVPTAIVVHHGGSSSSKSEETAFSSVMILESQWRFFRKTRSLWYCWTYRLVMFFVSVIRIGLFVVMWPVFIARGRGGSINGPLKKWKEKLGWTLGSQKWVKSL